MTSKSIRKIVAAALVAAALGGRAAAHAAPGTSPGARARDARHVVLKFAEGTDLRRGLGAVGGILERHRARVERGFTQDPGTLARLKREAERRSGERLADLDLYIHLHLPEGARTGSLLNALNAHPSVETAYAQFVPSEPTHDGATPDFSAQQVYPGMAPDGIEALYARTVAGGAGAGVRIVDVERGWSFDHEDLQLPSTTLISGGIRTQSRYHGTAVLGELVARNNGFGVTGLVPSAQVRAASACRAVTSSNVCSTYSVAQAITDATNHLLSDGARAGVILIEQQGIWNDGMFAPVEAWKQEYDAIKLAVARGITVVEAAGNGGRNLDNLTDTNGTFILRRSYRDSGAIMVGAAQGSCDTCIERAAVASSNFGSRVDLQGWGQNVVTLGYGDLWGKHPNGVDEDSRRFYTNTFSGTSSASPMVTAAVASVQGVSLSRFGLPMRPKAVRALLRATGSPQSSNDVTTKPIGPQPNLRAAINRFQSSVTNAYRFSAPTAGSSFSDWVWPSVTVHNWYLGIIDRFEVGAYYSNSPRFTAPYWHQPVVTLHFYTTDGGQCSGVAAGASCTVSDVWDARSVPAQQVILHGWAINDDERVGANRLPSVTISIT